MQAATTLLRLIFVSVCLRFLSLTLTNWKRCCHGRLIGLRYFMTHSSSAEPALVKPALSDMGSADGYQKRDAEIVDYNIWKLWTQKAGFSLRGPRPNSFKPG